MCTVCHYSLDSFIVVYGGTKHTVNVLQIPNKEVKRSRWFNLDISFGWTQPFGQVCQPGYLQRLQGVA